jgi:hypothetical protein
MTAANAARVGYNPLILFAGAPEGIRTPDQRFNWHFPVLAARHRRCLRRVIHDWTEPAAGPAMSVVPPKAAAKSGQWHLPRRAFAG